MGTMNYETALLSLVVTLVVFTTGLGAWLVYINLMRRVPPTAYQTMERTMADMTQQMSELREQQAADHQAMRSLRSEVARLDARLAVWQDYARTLARMLENATGQEPPPEPADATPAPVTLTAVGRPGQLAKLITERFSLDEITNLAFELGIDGDVTGASTKTRAQSLVGQANRRGLTERLIELCREQRPGGGF